MCQCELALTQAPPCTRAHADLKAHVWLAPHPGGWTAVWGATEPLPPRRTRVLTGRAGGQQAPSTDTHLPQAGRGQLAGRVGGAGQAGQQHAAAQGRVQAAVQQVLHQPAAEEGGWALELHAPHLKLHTCGGRRDRTPAEPHSRARPPRRAAMRAGPCTHRRARLRPAATPPRHGARGQPVRQGSWRPSGSGETHHQRPTQMSLEKLPQHPPESGWGATHTGATPPHTLCTPRHTTGAQVCVDTASWGHSKANVPSFFLAGALQVILFSSF